MDYRNQLSGVILCLTTKVPINTHPLPYCLKKGGYFLWSDGTGERSLRPNIVGFFVSTHNSLKSLLVFKYL